MPDSLNAGYDDFDIAMDQYGPNILEVNETWIAANQTACRPSPLVYRFRLHS